MSVSLTCTHWLSEVSLSLSLSLFSETKPKTHIARFARFARFARSFDRSIVRSFAHSAQFRLNFGSISAQFRLNFDSHSAEQRGQERESGGNAGKRERGEKERDRRRDQLNDAIAEVPYVRVVPFLRMHDVEAALTHVHCVVLVGDL